MKMIKEIQEEPFQEASLSNKDASKKDEPIQKDLNSENLISEMTSILKKLSVKSEESNSSIKESTLLNKENKIQIKTEEINGKEKEKKKENEIKSNPNFPKKNLALSIMLSNDMNILISPSAELRSSAHARLFS